jgi:hypothetical protein
MLLFILGLLTDLKTKLQTSGKYADFLEEFKLCRKDEDRLKLLNSLDEVQDMVTGKTFNYFCDTFHKISEDFVTGK